MEIDDDFSTVGFVDAEEAAMLTSVFVSLMSALELKSFRKSFMVVDDGGGGDDDVKCSASVDSSSSLVDVSLVIFVLFYYIKLKKIF